jgi:hypothetical protein
LSDVHFGEQGFERDEQVGIDSRERAAWHGVRRYLHVVQR